MAVVADGVTYPALPSLATVAAMSVDEMVEFAGNRQRAERVLGVARGVAALDESWLRTAPYDEARRALLAINGVGPFTAHGLLIRALGRPDEVPLEMAQFTRDGGRDLRRAAAEPGQAAERSGDQIGWWAYVTRTALAWLPEPAARRRPAEPPGRRPTPPVIVGASAVPAARSHGWGAADHHRAARARAGRAGAAGRRGSVISGASTVLASRFARLGRHRSPPREARAGRRGWRRAGGSSDGFRDRWRVNRSRGPVSHGWGARSPPRATGACWPAAGGEARAGGGTGVVRRRSRGRGRTRRGPWSGGRAGRVAGAARP